VDRVEIDDLVRADLGVPMPVIRDRYPCLYTNQHDDIAASFVEDL
jgi:hypothetical protein